MTQILKSFDEERVDKLREIHSQFVNSCDNRSTNLREALELLHVTYIVEQKIASRSGNDKLLYDKLVNDTTQKICSKKRKNI